MPSSNSLGAQIEAALSPIFEIDPAGHTQKMLRYRTASGIPFAIVRNTSGSAQFWFSANDRLKAAVETAGFRCEKNVPNTTLPKSSGSG